jgi:hypothetical protein
MVFSLFTSGILLFFIQYIQLFGIVRRNVYHNDRGGYVSSRHVCLWLPIQNRRIAPGHDFSSISGEFRFAAGPALGGLIIMNMGYGGLFWVDGSSCIISILIFTVLVKKNLPI